MNINVKKKWTILIYADGNNEMEPVIYNTILHCKSINTLDNVNVVIEIGLLGSNTPPSSDKWCGVRRYFLSSPLDATRKNHSLPSTNYTDDFPPSGVTLCSPPVLIEDLGKQNMADPNNLYKFVTWGMKNYSADHYMVIISGHGTNFVGGLTDLSNNKKYIMGIPEMFKAISLACISTSSVVDILILDMCFMNSIETLYEVSQYSNVIKFLINYTDFAPYEGLDYKKLINFLEGNPDFNSTALFIKNLIATLPFDLIAYRLDIDKMDSIKKTFCDFALSYLVKKIKVSPVSLVKNLQPISNNSDEISNLYNLSTSYIEEINKKIQDIVISTKNKFLGLNSSINITCDEIGRLIGFYSKLGFSKENYWTKLLSSANPSEVDTTKVMVRTVDSSISSVHYLLSLKIDIKSDTTLI